MTAPGRRGSGGHLEFIHVGAFSGSALSLRDALQRMVHLRVVDLLPQAQRLPMLPARLAAWQEARRSAPGTPWHKTAQWSRALQTHVEALGVARGRNPLLIVQTLAAMELPATVPYAVYTDRVALEGAAAPVAHRSRYSPGWLEREKTFLRRATRVFVMGPSTQQVLQQVYRVPAERIEVTGGGPNASLSAARARDRCRRLLFVGVEWERKGGRTLLDAFRGLRTTHPDLELVVVGSNRVPREPGLRILGRVPHSGMDRVFDACDLLVHPTRMEAFGIVLVEALRSGLPCVHSSVGNQSWIVGDAGLSVPPDDPSTLRRALETMIAGYPAFQTRAITRGRQLEHTMTWAAIATRILAHLCPGTVEPCAQPLHHG